MLTLSNLQFSWKDYILNQDIDVIKSCIVGDASQERLAIYADAYMARLLEAMQKIFPQLLNYMGEENFEKYAAAYLKNHPSTYYSISRIGENFSDYLSQLSDNHHVFADIANLEWAISCAIDASDGEALTHEDLQKIPQDQWSNIIFELHASLQLLEFDSHALKIYEGKMKRKTSTKSVNKNYCRVWRKDTQVFYQAMTHIEFIFLQNILQKKSFAEICEILSEMMPEDETVNYALSKLIQWLSDKLMTGVRFTNELV